MARRAIKIARIGDKIMTEWIPEKAKQYKKRGSLSLCKALETSTSQTHAFTAFRRPRNEAIRVANSG